MTSGQEGVRLALDSEKAVTDKAGSRNLPAPTVPFIRHALKKAQAAGLLSQPSTAETEVLAFLNCCHRLMHAMLYSKSFHQVVLVLIVGCG